MKTVVEYTNRGRMIAAGCLAVLVVVGLTGCGKKTPPAPDANQASVPSQEQTLSGTETAPAGMPAPETAAPEPAPDAAVVTVNGKAITEQQVSTGVNMQIQRAGAQLSSLPAAFIEQFKKQVRQQVVDNLVAETLLDQAIKKANIEVTDEQVVASIEEQGALRNPPVTLEDFKQMIASRGGSFDDVKAQYKIQLARQRYFESQWTGKIDVNDAEVKAFYDENPDKFEVAEQIQASHILIKPAADANDPNEAKAVAKAEAEKLLAEVRGGADFAELAKAHSDCPSAPKGGDLGLFGHGQMVPAFDAAAFALEPGQVSDVVETQFGYHIIKVTDKKAASKTSFEEAEPQIREGLTNQKKGQFAQGLIESLKAAATIEYAEGAEPTAPMPMPGGAVN